MHLLDVCLRLLLILYYFDRKSGRSVKFVFDKPNFTTKGLKYANPVRESIIRTTRRRIEDHLRLQNLEKSFVVQTNLASTIRHRASCKWSETITDLSLVHGNTANPVLVQEVGFAEKYDNLVKSTRLWLENEPTTKAVLLVNIDETPKYRSPLRITDYISCSQSAIPIPTDLDVNNFSVEDPRDPNAPLMLNKKRWVGRVSAFFEVWTRNEGGEPVRKGDRAVSPLPL